MRRSSTLLATVLVAVVLVGSGCEAPLAPKSKQTDAAAPEARTDGAPSPTADPGPTAPPSPTQAASPTPAMQPTPPKIDLPTLRPLPTKVIEGSDISWPQCPKGMGIPQKRTLGLPPPLPSARFVIMGLTNGPAFTPNPCLASQVQWVKDRHLLAAAYAVNSFPDEETIQRYARKGPFDGGTRLGGLSNVGYQQASFNLSTMARAGLQSPVIWLDVEPVPQFEWSADKVANAAVVRGAARAYTDAGFRIGTYSTAYLWQQVVGDLRLGIPEWRAAGQTSRAEALRRCGPDRVIQGGEAVLAQWVESNRDRNVTCPGTSLQLLRWFHQY